MISIARLLIYLVVALLVPGCSGEGQKPFGEIEWQGEKYKLSRSFRDWEDYKKAENQLAPSEARRVFAKATSLPVPAKFPSIEGLVENMPKLRFPGYGYASDGSVSDTNGGRYQLTEYTIPLAGKRRALLYREEKDRSFTLVLDEVFEERADEHLPEYVTNRRIVVEAGILRVYVNGKIHREAPLKPAVY